MAEHWRVPRDAGRFNIGLLGNQNENRAVEPLFKVLAALRDTAPDLFARLGIIQVGQVDREWFGGVLEKYGLGDRVVIHGFQKRDDTVRLLSEASLFYIGLDADREQKIMPARMFDLLASGRPVLAYVAAESEIARLLDLTGAGIYFNDETFNSAVSFVKSSIEKSITGELSITPLPEYARPYSSEAMVEKFANLLDSLT
jgi:glycosyltransferase involved in cell wall biosynthesis